MFRWSNIIEQNREKLIEALESAYKEAVDCRHMQYVVEIYKDGTIRTWACAAGSSSFSADSWNGESTVVGTYCLQYMDIEVTEEDFRRHMTAEEQQDVAWRAEEDGLSFLNYIYNSGNYMELIEEVEQEWLDWYKDEYIYTVARDTVQNKIINEYECERGYDLMRSYEDKNCINEIWEG